MQEFITTILLIGAVLYLISHFRKNLGTKATGCAKGCGSCKETDLEKNPQKRADKKYENA